LSELVIYENNFDDHVVTFELITTRILIGSSPDNQLVLETNDIAPAHVSLENRHGYWILQDLGSELGTKVNGNQVVGPYHLANNDLIELGHIKLKFQHEVTTDTPTKETARIETTHEIEDIKGRVWLATVAGGTLAIISIILLILALAHYFHFLDIFALFP